MLSGQCVSLWGLRLRPVRDITGSDSALSRAGWVGSFCKSVRDIACYILLANNIALYAAAAEHLHLINWIFSLSLLSLPSSLLPLPLSISDWFYSKLSLQLIDIIVRLAVSGWTLRKTPPYRKKIVDSTHFWLSDQAVVFPVIFELASNVANCIVWPGSSGFRWKCSAVCLQSTSLSKMLLQFATAQFLWSSAV